VWEKFTNKMGIGIVLILLVGFSMIFLGSYFAFKYGRNWGVVLLPYPSYSTEEMVAGVLTSENPNYTFNISYYSLYGKNSNHAVTPYLKGYLEVNDTVNFYINITEPGWFERNPVFKADSVSSANFTVEVKKYYNGTSEWVLYLEKNATNPVNFTIHYYQEIHRYEKFLADLFMPLSEMQIHEYKNGYWMHVYYEFSWLYVGVQNGFIFAGYSIGGVWNPQIIDNAYLSITLGMILVASVMFFHTVRISLVQKRSKKLNKP